MMINNTKHLLLRVIILAAIGLNLSAAVAEDTVQEQKKSTLEVEKVLFVGNSFSFYNNGIHNHLGALIRANGRWKNGQHRLRLQTLSGGHMYEQLEGLQATLTNDAEGWQVVVLQAHSSEPVQVNKKDRFEHALTEAISIVKSHHLQPILFMTWGYKGNEDMAQKLIKAYIKQGHKHKVPVVPVGVAFAQAAALLPNIELYVEDVLGIADTPEGKEITYRRDWKHPSEAGTYLAACVFYASLYQQSPLGNPFTAGLDVREAKALQALSWEIVKNFQTEPYSNEPSNKRNSK